MVISPFFEKLSEQYPNADFYKVNVDEAGDIVQEVGIRAVCTFRATVWIRMTERGLLCRRCPPS